MLLAEYDGPMKFRVYPSVLAADFVNMEAELQKISSADSVHVDVMDGHFVPAISFGPQMVKRIVEVSPVPLDVHLMIEKADDHAERYAELGAHSVTFHVEAAKNVGRVISSIASHGAAVGIAIAPNTPLEPYLEHLSEVDLVLIMTVEPGAGGQPFLHTMLPKIEKLCSYLEEHKLSPLVQVDGGITAETLPVALRSGANTFVAGSSVFGHGSPADNIAALRSVAATTERSAP